MLQEAPRPAWVHPVVPVVHEVVVPQHLLGHPLELLIQGLGHEEYLQEGLSAVLLFQVPRPVLLEVLLVLHQGVPLVVRQWVVLILVALSVGLAGEVPQHHQGHVVLLLAVVLEVHQAPPLAHPEEDPFLPLVLLLEAVHDHHLELVHEVEEVVLMFIDTAESKLMVA